MISFLLYRDRHHKKLIKEMRQRTDGNTEAGNGIEEPHAEGHDIGIEKLVHNRIEIPEVRTVDEPEWKGRAAT